MDEEDDEELPHIEQEHLDYFMSLEPWQQRTDEFDNITICE